MATLAAAAVALSWAAAGATPTGPVPRACPPGADCSRADVETSSEVMSSLAQLTQRLGTDTPGSLANAASTRESIAATVPAVAGGDGTWVPVGTTPLDAQNSTYSVYGEGFGNLAGRINDFFYDNAHHELLAAVASGGVWESTDTGQSWRSIGDTLPVQQTSSVAYTPARGGTIVVLTGDNAFGGYTYGGAGAFWSTNNGGTWHLSAGIPDGAMGFRLAVDPGHPNVLYAATGVGLYRSVDAGRSFVNVDLPTGTCHGNSYGHECFLANIVTDVVVQAKDSFGHAGGAVLAVVGWRAGALPYPDGQPQSPGNGLYLSTSGTPGSFRMLNPSGFAPQANIGRVALGVADGPAQNHGYVYAVVQDAKLFDTKKIEGLDQLPDGDPLGIGLVNPTKTPTYLNGVYVSADFGSTWTLMEDHKQFLNPANGSGLAQLVALGDAPGIQSWYDEWIRPDPTRQLNGIPTRVDMGLEEIYENRDTLVPQIGPTDFHVIAPYTAGGGVCIVVAAEPACSALRTTPGWITVHPDQHAAIWVPDGKGGVTLVVGHDGGANTQHVGSMQELTQQGFGTGANNGFHTLLPYGVAVANDGVVYSGLQDNGEMRIERNGSQVEVFGGDGVFTVVDPKNSKVAYEETPYDVVRKTTDGGVTWTSIDPLTDNGSFYAPIVMDPANARHIVTGGRQVMETLRGSDTSSGSGSPGSTTTSWIRVFDLGTVLHPGQKATYKGFGLGSAVVAPGDIQNQISAVGVQGSAVYVGYCGSCDPLLDKTYFHAGIATNVGGTLPPKAETANGWHFVPAAGLPQRLITSITVDPKNPQTLYVTLGASTLRPYFSAKASRSYRVADGGGFLWKSTDGGRSFFDISGNLPAIGGTWTVLRGDQLIAGSTVGVFASTSSASGASARQPLRFSVLGRGLPTAPIFSMALKADDPNTLLVASLGRGVYRYTFTAAGRQKPSVLGSHVTPTGSLPATGVPGADPFAWVLLGLAGALVARRRLGGAQR